MRAVQSKPVADMKLEKARVGTIAALAAAVLAAGCAASPQLEAQWTDPALGANSRLLRGARVLIACEAYDLAVRQVCRQQLSAEVAARGATPVFVASNAVPTRESSLDAQLLPEARASQAAAVLVVTLTPAATDTSSGFSLGIGGFGFGRSSAVGGGISAPIGGGRVATGFAANGRVTSVASGRLAWTASAVAPPSTDLNEQFAALSRTVLDSAARAGLF